MSLGESNEHALDGAVTVIVAAFSKRSKHKANPKLTDQSGKAALDYARKSDEIMGTKFVQEEIVVLFGVEA